MASKAYFITTSPANTPVQLYSNVRFGRI